jgi:hypothetical protein
VIHKLAGAALLLLVFCSTTSIAATSCPSCNFVVNGSFETGDFTGWTLSGDTSLVGVCDVSSCPGSFPPYDGAFAAYFGPVGNTATITQDIATVAGTMYTLSFFLANPVGGTPSSFTVSFGVGTSAVAFTLTNGLPFNWTQYTFVYTASGAVTPLAFTFQNDPAYWFLDEVAVGSSTQPSPGSTPEPGTLGLLATGIIVIKKLAWRG